MENIILTNNKDLRLVGVKVGVLSTLRFELPLVSASATHVEVIVTSGNVHSAYTATFIDATKRWQCDIAASQFPEVGKQSYEVAYVLDGKQFWDGKGWIEIEDATTSGIEPQPRPEPYRYAVVSVNGYGADAQGAVRIPKTFIAANSPETTEGFMEGDIYFNRETGATWTLCNVQSTLTWVFNYKNYYTKAETEEAIDRVAAYYITYDAAGNPFPTYAALANATTVYSGGAVRAPTRNDYCVVLADETHDNAEYRYIYAVAEGQTTGSWQPQFPVEGVMTVDQTVTKNSTNPVSGGGIWSAIWGALSALPTGFSSLYDWCVSQLAGKVPTSREVNGKALSSDVTLTGADIAVSGSDATKINAALAGKATKADATLTPIYSDTPTFSEWVFSPEQVTDPGGGVHGLNVSFVSSYSKWRLRFSDESFTISVVEGNLYDTSLQFPSSDYIPQQTVTATRTRTDIIGYTLGSQSDKPLQPKGDYPTKAQMDAGWWSETGVCTPSVYNGRPVFAATALTDSGYNPDVPDSSNLTGCWCVFYADSTTRDARASLAAPKNPADVTGETIVWDAIDSWGSGVTATRHRVAAPVPTKPEDIGAANRAANPTAGNLAALDANGNPTDAGYHFEVRNGIPCIVQYT